MDKITWKGENVLVTGADGFIGSHIASALIQRDANVTTIVRDLKRYSNLDILNLKDKINILQGDLVNFTDCERAFNEYEINFCFHLAAQSIVGPANNSPLSTFESNIKGTWNILECARFAKNIKGMVVASSDKAYGKQEILPYTENSPMHGYHPYDVSKACTEMLAKSYFKTYGLSIAITRNANTYGPADMNFSRIVPDVISKIIKGEQPVIRSDGTPERDYMYIKDAVSAYLTLAENIANPAVVGEAFNFGTGIPISVLQMYKKISSLMNKNEQPKIIGEAKNEIDRQFLSSEKAFKILGWKHKFSIDEGLKETLDWYKSYFSK